MRKPREAACPRSPWWLATRGKTNFPEGACDALFEERLPSFRRSRRGQCLGLGSVKPGARVAVVDFSPPNEEAKRPADRGKDGMHGIRAETLSAELKAAGFEPVSSALGDERWFMVVVARPSR